MISGSRITVTIEKLVNGGAGLARENGQVIFIPGTGPGEVVSAQIRAVKKGYAQAELQAVLKPSPDRVPAPCPVFGKCGGCQWQHLSYAAQVKAKLGILREDLERIGRVSSPEIFPPLETGSPFAYRTRIQLKLKPGGTPSDIGFFSVGSHAIVPVESCPIAAPPLNAALARLREVQADLDLRLASLTDVHLNLAGGTGEIQIRCFGEEGSTERVERFFERMGEGLTGLVSQVYYGRGGERWIGGRDYLNERYLDAPFRVSDRSFTQVNLEQTPALIQTVLSFAGLTGTESVLELYCGIGTFGIFLARQASGLAGFDENGAAIEDARHNARQNGLKNCRFSEKPVDEGLFELEGEKQRFDCAVLDPPREGMNRRALESLVRIGPKRIVYVSCNPSTLARDLKILTAAGYLLGRIQPIDFFPQTVHLETVVQLTKE